MGFQIFGNRHLTDERPWSNPDHDIAADIRNFALTQCGAPFVGWDSPEHPAFTYGDPPKWCGCASCDCGKFPPAHK